MPEYVAALIYDSSINLAGLERDKKAAIDKLHSIGAEATKTFQNDIARGLAKAVRPEHFAADVAKAKAILGSIGPDTSKILERELGRNLARKTLQPFLDESRSLGAQIKSSLSSSFSIKNIAGGFLAADLVSSTLRGLFDIGSATVNIARDAAETRNKFNVIFGDLSDEVRAFANSYADSVGRARIDTEDFLSTISGIFTTVGFAGREAADFSKEITKLTFDLASFFNTTDNEALTALRAGLIGESEPLRRFNVFLSEARLETEALAFGIKKTGKEFSNQEKTFLRYQIIMKDTALAQGDALRTAESFANQQKAFSANLKNLGESVGNVVLPPLNSLISVVNDIIKSFENTTEIEDAEKRLIKFGIAADEISFRRLIDKSTELSDKAKQLGEDYVLLAKDTKVLGEVVRSIFPERALQVIASEDEAKRVIEFTKIAGFRLQIEQEITKSKRKVVELQKELATADANERKRLLDNQQVELDRIENLQKVITAQDEIARAEKEAAEATQRAAEAQERIDAGAQAVSDNVQTLSSSAENTADSFERSAKAVKEIELSLESGEGFGIFKKSFQAQIDAKFNTPTFEIDEAAFGAFKKSFQAKTKELFKGEFPPTEEDIRRSEEKRRRLQQEFVYLADAIDRGLGDVAASLFSFIDTLRDSNASIVGKLAGGLNLFSSAFSVFNGLFSGLNRQNDLERAQHFQEAEEARRLEEERLLDIGRQLTDQYEKLSDALLGFGVQSLQNQFLEIQDSIKNLIGTTRDLTEEQIRQILSVQGELKRVNEEISALLRSGEDVPQELLEKQKQLTDELAKFGGSLNDLTAEQILRLNELFKESGLVKNALDNFGKFANDFSGLINQLNFSFDVLNIDDPVQKLASLQKEIEKKFKAIIPTTEAGIRDLITQGVAALEVGGQTLIDFLKSRDLEELTAEQFRDLLQLLNNLANEAKSKVADITDTAQESVLSQVRQITFEQGNAVIDNLVTSRIILTNILDAERQMLDLARRNIGLTGTGAVALSTRDRFFFFNDGVISETSAAALSQLQRKMYNDALAAAGGKGLS